MRRYIVAIIVWILFSIFLVCSFAFAGDSSMNTSAGEYQVNSPWLLNYMNESECFPGRHTHEFLHHERFEFDTTYGTFLDFPIWRSPVDSWMVESRNSVDFNNDNHRSHLVGIKIVKWSLWEGICSLFGKK